MASDGLVRLSKQQVSDAKANLDNLERLLRNADALLDAGAITKEQLEQAKVTKDIIQRTLKAYPQE